MLHSYVHHRDRGKYLMYAAAIEACIEDMAKHKDTWSEATPFRCVVVGPGLGRLPKFVLDACDSHGIHARLLLVEANELAVEELREYFVGELHRVTIVNHAISPSALTSPSSQAPSLPDASTPFLSACMLSVSELLGCFGDNEFLTELTSCISRLFMNKSSVLPIRPCMIPESCDMLVTPIHSPSLAQHFEATRKDMQRTYLTGQPSDAILLGPCTCVYRVSSSIGECDPEISARVSIRNDRPGLELHGFLGYFTSVLYRDFIIDTRHDSPTWNAYHWEAFLFPVAAQTPSDSAIDLRLRRRVSTIGPRLRLWYEWASGDGVWANADGNHDAVFLGGEL